MPLKTLVTVVTDLGMAAAQVRASATLARRHDAHLDILALGIDDVHMGYYFAGADMVLHETAMEAARDAAEARHAAATAAARAEDVRWSSQALVVQIGLMADAVGQATRFADLAVLPRPNLTEGPREAEATLEAVLFAAQVPVLLLPGGGISDTFPRRAVIGWNEGGEALRAVRGALPLLRTAEGATVAVIDPPLRGMEAAAPGTRLSTLLDRHGVAAEVALLPKTRPRLADCLFEQVRDRDADLLVTGAYGHTRFREALLGGATRDLLAGAEVPLLLAR